jgi:NADH-quinone oxidoreductase subunit C
MNEADLQEITQRLHDEIGHGTVVALELETAQPGLVVDAERMTEVALVLRDVYGFDRLLDVAGVDHEGYDAAGKGKHRKIAQYSEDGTVQAVTEAATGDLGVTYHLQHFATKQLLVVKVRVPRDAARVGSVSAVWPTAAWGERETYDMFGIEFEGHPDLRRLLLPEDWVGHPLRKVYEMPSRYHDVPLEGLPLAVRARREAGPEADGGDAS